MTPAEARTAIAEIQAERGIQPPAPQPVSGMDEVLDILVRDDMSRFDDATRFLEGKSGVDAVTLRASFELAWSDGYGGVAQIARELGRRAEVEATGLRERRDSGRQFTDKEEQMLAQLEKTVAFNAKAAAALGVLSRDHIAAGGELVREALRQFPNDARSYRVAAFYFLSTADWQRYEDAMDRLKDAEATDAGLLYLRAVEALKRNAIREEARQFLKQALIVNPKLVRAQARLVPLQEDIGATYAELLKLEAMAPSHPVVRLTGPGIKSEYETAQALGQARGTVGVPAPASGPLPPATPPPVAPPPAASETAAPPAP